MQWLEPSLTVQAHCCSARLDLGLLGLAMRRPWVQCSFVLQGIFISRVSEEGPAARAGVRVGDKLLEVSQQPPATI